MTHRLNHYFTIIICSFLILLGSADVMAQRKAKKDKEDETEKAEKHYLESLSVSGMKFRSVGPAITSGRISDFAINPANEKEWYVATSSGGVWKTDNAGTTFRPIFDGQGSYSIGCITMDPNNHNLIWVGTGENNNQRSVAYGDGIYRSEDGGRSWKNMGLKESEHISKIIVHPDNSDVIYVAAYGPLWSAGGDRGIYKSEDGGKTWDAVLTVSKHTGFSDLVMDPRNPDVMYAAAHQRRRHVFTYHGGGPESGLYKTVDGGKTWEKANKGLPGGDKGRIGLTISPADPEYIYAIVEAAGDASGFYRSTNRGASWEKRSGYVTSGNYYQEIVACPHDRDRVFSMNTYLNVTTDGGKSFNRTGERHKHVDNHCMWIDPADPDHWLLGCDGGIYETYDGADTWDYFPNLPITQFYKVAVDNDAPFYNIYGGTQDNYSMGGPARSTSASGIVNSDWFMTHGGDGFESQIDPKNPNIVYSQSQYGVLVRYDKLTGEEVGIQPQPRKGENSYRWNWDAPLQISNHVDGRLYFAANKLFRSDDRGNSWQVLGDDLSRQIDRNKLKVMGQVWGIDAVTKHRSTSPYGTIVAFSESPKNADLLYVGTDDGLVQISEDGGKSWTKISSIPGVPDTTYVNMLYASRHDENVVYACFNHHKYGDFKPYVFKSMDKGRTWKSITANLPERGSSYCIEEDHVDPNLLFVGTEFGVHFSSDGGQHWKKLGAGLPTIAVRDMDIQERESDLVLGTFGRGFYVLDDYAPLRSVKEDNFKEGGMIFPIRDALMFEESAPLGGRGKSYQGDQYYTAENLGPVAIIAYTFNDEVKSLKSLRKEREKESTDDYNPTYEELKAEEEQQPAKLIFVIKNSAGDVVSTIYKGGLSKGVKRLEWDLRTTSKRPIRVNGDYNAFQNIPSSHFVNPGTYTVQMLSEIDGETKTLTEPVAFQVRTLGNSSIPTDMNEVVAMRAELEEFGRKLSIAQGRLRTLNEQLNHSKRAMQYVNGVSDNTKSKVMEVEKGIKAVEKALYGDPYAGRLDMDTPPGITSRFGMMRWEFSGSTSMPTKTHRDVLRIVQEELKPVSEDISGLRMKMDEILDTLAALGSPYVPGQ